MTLKQEDFDKIVAKHMDNAMEKYVVSKYSEWSNLITETNKSIKSVNEKMEKMDNRMNTIEIQMKPIITDAEFSKQFWARIKTGGNFLTWLVLVIGAILILMGYIKVTLITWLSSKII